MSRRPILVLSLSLLVLAVARAEDNPLAKAKAGEWIIQKNVIGGSMTTYDYVYVAKVEGKKVTLARQPLGADLKTPAGPARMAQPVDSEKPLAATKNDRKVGEEEIEIKSKNKKLKCTKTESTVTESSGGTLTTTTWVSSEVPVYGIVKQIAKDKDGKELLNSQLIDWGSEGGKEKTAAKDDKKTEKK